MRASALATYVLAAALAIPALAERVVADEPGAYDLATLRPTISIRTFTAPITGIRIPPGTGTVASCHTDGRLLLWRKDDGSIHRILRAHDGPATSMAASDDGEYVMTGGQDGRIAVWRTRTGARMWAADAHFGAVTDIEFLDGALEAITAGEDGAVCRWRIENGRRVDCTYLTEGEGVHSVAVIAPGAAVVSSEDGVSRVWTWENGRESSTQVQEGIEITSAAVSPDGRRLVTAGYCELDVWRIDAIMAMVGAGSSIDPDSAVIRRVATARPVINALSWAQAGRSIVSAADNHVIDLWEAATGSPLLQLSGHAAAVTSFALEGDGETLYSGSADGTMRVWDLASTENLESYGYGDWDVEFEVRQIGFGDVQGVAITDDNRHIVTGGSAGQLQVWDLRTGELETILRGHQGAVHCVAASPDTTHVVSGSADHTLTWWDIGEHMDERAPVDEVDDSDLAPALVGHSDDVTAVAVEPGGALVASGCRDGLLILWSRDAGFQPVTRRAHAAAIRDVAFTRDGQYCLTAGEDGRTGVWRTDDCQLVGYLAGHAGPVTAVAAGPDNVCITAGADGTVRVWRLALGEQRVVLRDRGPALTDVVVSPDGEFILASSVEGALHLWTFPEGEAVRSIPAHRGAVADIAISRDGQYVASAGEDGLVRLWKARAMASRVGPSGR